MVFLISFLQYLVKFLVFVAIAVAGVFAGKKLRANKDAKNIANDASTEKVAGQDRK